MSLDDGAASFIQQNFPSPFVNLKALRVFRIEECKQLDVSFFQQWKIPSLEELEIDLETQSFILSSSMAIQTLRSCTLLLSTHNVQMMEIVVFLSTARNLRFLKMDLYNIRHSQVSKIRLPCLHTH